MKNLRKRINIRLVNNEKDFIKYTSRPTHITLKIFDKSYAAIHKVKPVLTLNKPIYVGITVLDLSKWRYMTSITDLLKSTFTLNYCLLTQTVLLLKSKSKDVYEEFFKHKHSFDLSSYPEDSKFFDETNKKLLVK